MRTMYIILAAAGWAWLAAVAIGYLIYMKPPKISQVQQLDAKRHTEARDENEQ